MISSAFFHRIYTLFSKSLPLELASRLWDVFCRDGEEFLFRAALGILKFIEDDLLHSDFDQLTKLLPCGLVGQFAEQAATDRLFKRIDEIRMVSSVTGGEKRRSFQTTLQQHVDRLSTAAAASATRIGTGKSPLLGVVR